MVRQGVTSMIFGEGESAAPVGGKQDADGATAWTDFKGYFAKVLKQGISTNIGSYVGSSQIWTYVRGPKAGPPTRRRTERRCRRRSGRRCSRARSALPVRSADRRDHGSIRTRWSRCAKWRRSTAESTPRTCAPKGNGVFESVAEALEIGRKARIPVDIIHLKIAEHKLWGSMPELVATIRQARANGQQVEANVYPYRAGQNNLSTIFPPWVHEGGRTRCSRV